MSKEPKIQWIAILIAIGLLMTGGEGNGASPPSDNSGSIHFEDLQNWQRHGEPVLRDMEPGGGFEVAADPHVFRTQDGAKLEDVAGQLQGPVCMFDDYVPFWFDPLGVGHEFIFPLSGLGAYRIFGETVDGHTFEAIKIDSTVFDS